jgi:hypothetical protein
VLEAVMIMAVIEVCSIVDLLILNLTEAVSHFRTRTWLDKPCAWT